MGAFFTWIIATLGQLLFEGWRTANALALVRMLAVSTERHSPVVPVLLALADEEPDSVRFSPFHLFFLLLSPPIYLLWLMVRLIHSSVTEIRRRRLRKFADLLSGGAAIPEALDSVPGLLPEEAMTAIRVGFDVGRPVEALRDAADYLSRQSESKVRFSSGSLTYVAAVALVGSSLLTFIAIWIIPKYKAIYDGFNFELPPLTKWLIHGLLETAGKYWYLFAWPFLALAVVLVTARGFLSELLRQGTFWRPRTWLATLVPRIHTPLILRCMGLAVDGGRPFPETLTNVAAHSRDRYVQRILGSVSARIADGEETFQVMNRSRLITSREQALFEASVRNGNLGWALRQTAVVLERQSAARMRFLIECCRPLLFVAMGAGVGVVFVALFLPLIRLIEKMV